MRKLRHDVRLVWHVAWPDSPEARLAAWPGEPRAKFVCSVQTPRSLLVESDWTLSFEPDDCEDGWVMQSLLYDTERASPLAFEAAAMCSSGFRPG